MKESICGLQGEMAAGGHGWMMGDSNNLASALAVAVVCKNRAGACTGAYLPGHGMRLCTNLRQQQQQQFQHQHQQEVEQVSGQVRQGTSVNS